MFSENILFENVQNWKRHKLKTSKTWKRLERKRMKKNGILELEIENVLNENVYNRRLSCLRRFHTICFRRLKRESILVML